MTWAVKASAAFAALLLFGAAADAAVAQTRPRSSLVEENRLGAPATTNSFKFNEKGRWNFDLDINEPAYRERKLNDVEAGAFFRINPSLRLGGSVRLDDMKKERPTPDEPSPRVRLITKYKF